MLLIHGEGEFNEAFATLFSSSAASGYRLIAIGLPGRLQSSGADDPGDGADGVRPGGSGAGGSRALGNSTTPSSSIARPAAASAASS